MMSDAKVHTFWEESAFTSCIIINSYVPFDLCILASSFVCLSTTIRYCVKTVKLVQKNSLPTDSPYAVIFCELIAVAKFRRNHPLQGHRLHVGYRNLSSY